MGIQNVGRGPWSPDRVFTRKVPFPVPGFLFTSCVVKNSAPESWSSGCEDGARHTVSSSVTVQVLVLRPFSGSGCHPSSKLQ